MSKPLLLVPTDGLRMAPWPRMQATALDAQWDGLASQPSTPNPFFARWYLQPALRLFDPAGRVRLAMTKEQGTLAGLMPVARSLRYGRHPVPHLGNWLHANCFLGAPLVRTGHEHAFWRALFEWADANAGTALFLHLAAIPLDSALAQGLIEVGDEQGRRVALVHRAERAMLATNLDPDTYLAAALPGKKRKEYRRQRARLAELGVLAVCRDDGAADIDAWIAHFLTLERSGWKGRAGSALASARTTEQLFSEALGDAARQGQLQRIALTLDGQPIAMLATFISPPGAFSFKTAFDERYARFSPGVLLQLENLALMGDARLAWCDSCAAEGHPMIDSLWTERRAIGRFSVAIGGRLRRAAFDRLLRIELGRTPGGLA